MTYVVFDLDETLAEVYPLFYFLCDLRLQKTTGDTKTIPDELEIPLNDAYTLFVHLVAEQEVSMMPLGILRPGILQVMETIKKLKDEGNVSGCAMYSNNGSLSMLEFVSDVIQLVLNDYTLFCDHIHWGREGRQREYSLPRRPGYANKTWTVLSMLLKSGPCAAARDLKPTDVYFFDDLEHPDLKAKLGSQYIHVEPYTFKASFQRIAELYYNALMEAGILMNAHLRTLYLKYIDAKKYNKPITIEEQLEKYERLTKSTANATTAPPLPDASIHKMLEVCQILANPPVNTHGGGPKKAIKKAAPKQKVQTRRKR
jgi:hypothetical protein